MGRMKLFFVLGLLISPAVLASDLQTKCGPQQLPPPAQRYSPCSNNNIYRPPPQPGTTGCDASNEGNVFYVTFMSNIPDQPKNVPYELFVATSAPQASVSVLSSTGVNQQKTVRKNQVVTFQIPRESGSLQTDGSSRRLCVVKVSSPQKIVVYGANREQYTTDAFLSLPENVIGTEYYAVTWFPPTNFAKPDHTQIAVAATSEASTVRITLPKAGGGQRAPSQPCNKPTSCGAPPPPRRQVGCNTPTGCGQQRPPPPPPAIRVPCNKPTGCGNEPCNKPNGCGRAPPPPPPPRVRLPPPARVPCNKPTGCGNEPCHKPDGCGRAPPRVRPQPPPSPCNKPTGCGRAPPPPPPPPRPCNAPTGCGQAPPPPFRQQPSPCNKPTGCGSNYPDFPSQTADVPPPPPPQYQPQQQRYQDAYAPPSHESQGPPYANKPVDFDSFPFANYRMDQNYPPPYPGSGDADGYFVPPPPGADHEDFSNIPCSVEYNGRTYRSGETITVELRPLQGVQLQARCDLTGTHIKSSRPISVFSGNARTAIGPGAITRDHLIEQLPPVPTWGRAFATFSTPRRTVGDYYKIVASEDGSQVTISGQNVNTQTKVLNAGEQWLLDLPCNTFALIKATKPILVMSFVKSQTVGTEKADPAMSLIMPIEQFGQGYTFNTVEGVATRYQNFMIIVARQGHENSLLLDGVPVQPAEGWHSVQGANSTVGYVSIRPGAHTISSRNNNARFATYIYGAGDRESYFYPTGMCLKLLTCPSTPGCCCQRCDRGLI